MQGRVDAGVALNFTNYHKEKGTRPSTPPWPIGVENVYLYLVVYPAANLLVIQLLLMLANSSRGGNLIFPHELPKYAKLETSFPYKKRFNHEAGPLRRPL